MRALGRLWPSVAALLWICGCAPVAERAEAPPPPAVEIEQALSGPSVVGHTDGRPTLRRIRGSVTAAAAPSGLVVIDVGAIDGVRERDSFVVYRGETYVGRIVVNSVLPGYAAARYGRSMRTDVAVGDTVATRLLTDF